MDDQHKTEIATNTEPQLFNNIDQVQWQGNKLGQPGVKQGKSWTKQKQPGRKMDNQGQTRDS